MSGELFDPVRRRLEPAPAALDRLLAELEDDLRAVARSVVAEGAPD
jgi:hypothetical protein